VVFEGVEDLVLDVAEILLECEFALLLLVLVLEFLTESLDTGWICASDRRTVTIESVGSGELLRGVLTTVVAL
jgi:hypothetical protein